MRFAKNFRPAAVCSARLPGRFFGHVPRTPRPRASHDSAAFRKKAFGLPPSAGRKFLFCKNHHAYDDQAVRNANRAPVTRAWRAGRYQSFAHRQAEKICESHHAYDDHAVRSANRAPATRPCRSKSKFRPSAGRKFFAKLTMHMMVMRSEAQPTRSSPEPGMPIDTMPRPSHPAYLKSPSSPPTPPPMPPLDSSIIGARKLKDFTSPRSAGPPLQFTNVNSKEGGGVLRRLAAKKQYFQTPTACGGVPRACRGAPRFEGSITSATRAMLSLAAFRKKTSGLPL